MRFLMAVGVYDGISIKFVGYGLVISGLEEVLIDAVVFVEEF